MLNLKKLSAITASTLLAGMTMGVAAAASAPNTLVPSGSANVAMVYGANAAGGDMVAATNIKEKLATYVSADGDTTVTGGDSVLLERSSDKVNLGDSASTVFVTSLDADDMPSLLADGTYTDEDNTEFDFTQKIALGNNLNITHFADSDYDDETPTIGIRLPDDTQVLKYTLDFTTNPAFNASSMETTTLTLMGREYYVLDVKGSGDASYTSDKITLLDSASSAVITEGGTQTVNGKEVSIVFVSSTEAIVEVDGQQTNTLNEGETYKLDDGTYVGLKDILYSLKDTGVSKVEVSIGSGKLELTTGSEIVLNDDTIEEVLSYIELDSSKKLDKLVLNWSTDDEAFVTKDSDLVMPGFESVKLSMADFIVPSTEEVTVEASGSDVIRLTAPIEDGTASIDLLGADANADFDTIGKDSTNRLATTTDSFLFFNETAGDKYIVASWNSTTESESYFLEIDMITEDNVNKVRFTNKVTGDSKKVTNASDASFGSVVLTVDNVTRDGSMKWANISINSGGSFHELYTPEGLKIYLPYNSSRNGNVSTGLKGEMWLPGTTNSSIAPVGHNASMAYLWFAEEDKDSNLAGGNTFNVTLDESGTSDKVHVSAVDAASSSYEIDDTDDFEEYVSSDLATKTLYKTGGDQDSVIITYAGDQSYAQLYVTSSEATVTTAGAADIMIVTDSEVSSVSSKQLVVVGGSCINSVAAQLVGGAYCGESFTDATGVGSGEFLIKGYASGINGKFALLVAGYEASDTTAASTYLIENIGSVDVSKSWEGTTVNSAVTEVTTA